MIRSKRKLDKISISRKAMPYEVIISRVLVKGFLEGAIRAVIDVRIEVRTVLHYFVFPMTENRGGTDYQESHPVGPISWPTQYRGHEGHYLMRLSQSHIIA